MKEWTVLKKNLLCKKFQRKGVKSCIKQESIDQNIRESKNCTYSIIYKLIKKFIDKKGDSRNIFKKKKKEKKKS